jgi:hypothetical protein
LFCLIHQFTVLFSLLIDFNQVRSDAGFLQQFATPLLKATRKKTKKQIEEEKQKEKENKEREGEMQLKKKGKQAKASKGKEGKKSAVGGGSGDVDGSRGRGGGRGGGKMGGRDEEVVSFFSIEEFERWQVLQCQVDR